MSGSPRRRRERRSFRWRVRRIGPGRLQFVDESGAKPRWPGPTPGAARRAGRRLGPWAVEIVHDDRGIGARRGPCPAGDPGVARRGGVRLPVPGRFLCLSLCILCLAVSCAPGRFLCPFCPWPFPGFLWFPVPWPFPVPRPFPVHGGSLSWRGAHFIVRINEKVSDWPAWAWSHAHRTSARRIQPSPFPSPVKERFLALFPSPVG